MTLKNEWLCKRIGADNVCIIPDVPNLAHIARYLADHPETVDALEGLGNWITQDQSWPALYGLIAAMRGEGGHDAG